MDAAPQQPEGTEARKEGPGATTTEEAPQGERSWGAFRTRVESAVGATVESIGRSMSAAGRAISDVAISAGSKAKQAAKTASQEVIAALRESVEKLSTDPQMPKPLIARIAEVIPVLGGMRKLGDAVASWERGNKMITSGFEPEGRELVAKAQVECLTSLLDAGVDASLGLGSVLKLGRAGRILLAAERLVELRAATRATLNFDLHELAAMRMAKSPKGQTIANTILKRLTGVMTPPPAPNQPDPFDGTPGGPFDNTVQS